MVVKLLDQADDNVEVNVMRPNKFRELLAAGKPSVGTRVHSTWPSIVEVIGHTGKFDYVEFVAEYAPYDL